MTTQKKEPIELDCIGMKCPRPIIEIAKLARKAPGSLIHIKANDLAFESDVNAWVDNSGASIVHLEKEGDVVLVQIQLAE
jgi:TusA-related sulfurtransferase